MKTKAEDLAIFGSPPAFEEKLHIGRPNIGSRERMLCRIGDMLERRWLTNNGAYVQEFEQRICSLLGVRRCIDMCNATVALEIIIRAAGLSGEVIIPSFTFIATAHALQWQEITPVFCDIDPRTHNIDPRKVEGMITPRTTGIIGVHVWGRPCNIEALTEIAKRHNLKLLFDAAHAFGCAYKRRAIGNFGLAEVFSFHATKFLNAFEGGAVVTNDDVLAAKVRLMKNFGFGGYDQVIYIGTNGKMNEAAAAMGLTSLESIDEFITINRRNYEVYQRELEDIPGINLIKYNEKENPNYQYIIIEVDEATTGVDRDQLMEILWAENVLVRRYFYPGCHRMEPYRSFFPHAGLLLPETEKIVHRVLNLPTGTAVGEEQVRQICQIMKLALENAALFGQRRIAGRK